MTIRIVEGVPYVYFADHGFLAVRGATPTSNRELEITMMMAELTGEEAITVPDLEVVPVDLRVFDEEHRSKIGFDPSRWH